MAKTDDQNYQRQGLQLFFELSGWLIGPIVVALMLGQWLDAKYQTKPWIFLTCLTLAFIATCIGIVKATKDFIKDIEKRN